MFSLNNYNKIICSTSDNSGNYRGVFLQKYTVFYVRPRVNCSPLKTLNFIANLLSWHQIETKQLMKLLVTEMYSYHTCSHVSFLLSLPAVSLSLSLSPFLQYLYRSLLLPTCSTVHISIALSCSLPTVSLWLSLARILFSLSLNYPSQSWSSASISYAVENHGTVIEK